MFCIAISPENVNELQFAKGDSLLYKEIKMVDRSVNYSLVLKYVQFEDSFQTFCSVHKVDWNVETKHYFDHEFDK